MQASRQKWLKVIHVAAPVMLAAAALVSLILSQRGGASRAQERAFASLQEETAEQAATFRRMLDTRFEVLETIGYASDPGAVQSEARLREAIGSVVAHTDFSSIYMADVNGRAISNRGVVSDVTGRIDFNAAMAGGRCIVEMPPDAEHAANFFILSVPVKNGGTVCGVLAGVIGKHTMRRLLTAESRSAGSFFLLCDSAGNVLAGTNDASEFASAGNVLDVLAKADVEGDAAARCAEALERGYTGMLSYEIDGRRRYVAYERAGVNDWMLFTVADGAVVDEAAAETTRSGVKITVVITGIALLLVAWIGVLDRLQNRTLSADRKRLMLSEERFRIALANTSVTIWDYDFATRSIVQEERSMSAHGFGKTVENVPEGLIESGYVHPEYADDYRAMYEKLFSGEPYAEGVFRVRTADGKGWWYEHIRYSNLFDERGMPYRAVGMSEDVTDRHAAKLAYERELTLQQVIVPDMLMTALFDVTGNRVIRKWFRDERDAAEFADATFTTFAERCARRVVGGEKPEDWVDVIDAETLKRRFAAGKRSMTWEHQDMLADGTVHWVQDESNLIIDPDSGHLMMFACLRDIENDKRAREALMAAARTDAMTGLLNHEAALSAIEAGMAACSKESPHALFIVDVDHFKSVNDRFGHQAGDAVIKEIARLIRGAFRDSDVVGRIGGDEFAVLMKSVGGARQVRAKAQELIERIQYVYCGEEGQFEVTGSVGVCICEDADKPAGAYFSEADAALYRAKLAGRNRFVVAGGADTGSEEQAGFSGVSSTVQFQTLLENMDGGVVLAEITDDIHIVYISPSLYRPLARLSDTGSIHPDDIMRFVSPEDRGTLTTAVLEAARQEAPLDLTYRVVTARGDEWRHIRGALLPHQMDGVRRMITVITDVTQLKRSEEQLALAERRYRTAVEQSKLMLWETNLVTGEITHSGELAKRLGLADKRIRIGQLLGSGIIRDDSKSEMIDLFDRLMRGEEADEHIIVAVDPDGKDCPLIVRYRLLSDAAGKPFHAVGIAEPLLYDSTELKLYRSMPHVGVFSTWADDAFTLLYANDLFFKMLNYTRESMLHRLGNSVARLIHPADLPGVQGTISNVLEAGGDFASWTNRLVTGTGELRYMQVSANFTAQADGSRILNGAIIDITEQKLNEQALATEKFKLDIALRNASVLIWEYDIVNRRIIRQQNALWHDSLSIVVDNAPLAVVENGFVLPDSADAFLGMCRELLEGARTAQADVHLSDVGGRDAWFHCSFHTVFDDDGRPVYAIGFGSDLTEIRAAQARLEQLRAERAAIDENAIGSFWLNVTKNECTSGRALDEGILAMQRSGTADGLIAAAERRIPDAAGRRAFIDAFSRESLLSAYARGQTTVAVEHRFSTGDNQTEWVRTAVSMTIDPESGDVGGLIYTRSLQKEATMRLVVERLVDVEYEFIALIDVETGRITIVSGGTNVPNVPRDGELYQEVYEGLLRGFIVENELDDALESLGLPWVCNSIAAHETCMLVYSVTGESGETLRKRWRFSYLDEENKTIVCTRSDVTHSFLSEVDPVTGVFNRYKLRNEVRELLDNNPDKRFVFIRMDIDNFKVFNDIYGLEAGDRVLTSFAAFLRSKRQPYMRYGHIEADHFACCLPEEAAKKLPIARQATEWLRGRNPEFDYSVRLGVYRIEEPEINVSLMSDRAWLALKSIKGKFGRHVAYYTEDMRRELLHEQEIVGEMRGALADGQFGIYVQPQYDYDTGAMVGAETLVRWMHPKKGVLPPSEFITAFERNGFIMRLDQFVWEQACRVLRTMLDSGETIVPISVNVSRVDLYDPNILSVLMRLVETYDIAPGLLRLEITESAYMENPGQLVQIVQSLRREGFPVEMDDFGSGYSSLNMLKDVQVDTLKLDMKFLSGAGDNTRGGNILSSIIRMARWLDLPVVAEGVETRAQADYLKSIGCPTMQGYYFAPPMPVDAFLQLVSDGGPDARHSAGAVEIGRAVQLWDASDEATMLFDSFMGGVMILEYARGNAEALRINDRFLQFLGTTREAYAPWMLHVQDRFEGESRARFLAAVEEAITTGREIACELVSLPVDAQQTAPIWTICQIRLIAHSSDGDILYLHMQNVSQSKKDSDALERERFFMQTFYDIAPCGVMEYVMQDGRFRLIGCNDAAWRIFGYESRAAYFEDMRDQLTLKNELPEDIALVKEMIDRVRNGEKRVDFTHRVVRCDGAVRILRSVMLRADSLEGVTSAQCVFFDVTDSEGT